MSGVCDCNVSGVDAQERPTTRVATRTAPSDDVIEGQILNEMVNSHILQRRYICGHGLFGGAGKDVPFGLEGKGTGFGRPEPAAVHVPRGGRMCLSYGHGRRRGVDSGPVDSVYGSLGQQHMLITHKNGQGGGGGVGVSMQVSPAGCADPRRRFIDGIALLCV